MPGDAKDFPANFTDEELAFLEGSFMIGDINLRKLRHKNEYSLICKKAPEMESIDFNDYIYCLYL